MIGPILVLITRLSGVPSLRVFLAPTDGQRPSSVDGVQFDGVRRVIEGVRLNAVTRCIDGDAMSRRFVGSESGLMGRRIDADRVIIVVALLPFAFTEFCFSRDRARSVVASIGAPLDRCAAARLADAARVRVRATGFSDFFGDLVGGDADKSAITTRFFGDAWRLLVVGPLLSDELSLPPSLVQSLIGFVPPTNVLPSYNSEQTLNRLELHDAKMATSPPPELLAYPALLLLNARCNVPTVIGVTPVSIPLSLPSPIPLLLTFVASPMDRLSIPSTISIVSNSIFRTHRFTVPLGAPSSPCVATFSFCDESSSPLAIHSPCPFSFAAISHGLRSAPAPCK